jgi:hypothetical protein
MRKGVTGWEEGSTSPITPSPLSEGKGSLLGQVLGQGGGGGGGASGSGSGSVSGSGGCSGSGSGGSSAGGERKTPGGVAKAEVDSLAEQQRRMSLSLPQFYVPREGGRGRGRPTATDKLEQQMDNIRSFFEGGAGGRGGAGAAVDRLVAGGGRGGAEGQGFTANEFVRVTKELCGMPSFFAPMLHARILLVVGGGGGAAGAGAGAGAGGKSDDDDGEGGGGRRVTRDMFCPYV